MFICNFKVNGGKILRIVILLLSLFMLIIFLFSLYRIFFSSGKFLINDEIEKKDVTEIEPENYTNILQAVHDNPDSYMGMKIKFTGYIYRIFDFSDEEFVLARDMFINESKTQTVVVGFLCQYKDAEYFEDGTWVNVTGIIKKDKYHNEEIPVVKIIKLEETTKPELEFVKPPQHTYIPTSGIF